jgi:hypothetical protein
MREMNSLYARLLTLCFYGVSMDCAVVTSTLYTRSHKPGMCIFLRIGSKTGFNGSRSARDI